MRRKEEKMCISLDGESRLEYKCVFICGKKGPYFSPV